MGNVLVTPLESTKLQVRVPSWQAVQFWLVTMLVVWSTKPPTKVEVLWQLLQSEVAPVGM